MWRMEMLTVVVIVVAVGVAAALAGVEVARRRLAAAPVAPTAGPDEAVRDAVALALVELRAQATAERDAAVHAAIEQAAVLGREQLGAVALQARQQSVAELGAKHDVIDSRLDQVRVEMRTELEKLSAMVAGMAEQSAQRFGQVDQSLRNHAEVTLTLSQSAQALREAMVSELGRVLDVYEDKVKLPLPEKFPKPTRVHAHRHLAAVAPQPPERHVFLVLAQHDAVVLREFVGPGRRGPPRQVVRGGAQEARIGRDRDRHHAGIRQVADVHDQVVALRR